jgi:outer membrane protein
VRRAPVLVLALALASPASAQTPAPLTFAGAVETSLDRNPQVALSRAAVAGARERVRGTRALRLPSLSAEGNLLFWDRALEFDLGEMLPPGADTTVRERVTANLTLTLAQPVTGFFVLGHLIGVEQDGLDAARADSDGTRLEVAAGAAQAFLGALQARAALEIGQKSLEQIEAQLERARVLERGGVLGRVNVLRLESARDTARQGVLKAQAGAATAVRALALAIGLPADQPLDVRDDLPDPPPRPGWDEEAAVAAAARNRPELRAARERVDQAAGARRVALAEYFPNILAVASYQHNEGQGTFAPKDAWYVGLTMKWNLWNWGKTGADVSEAAQRRQQALVVADSLGDQVVFDARRHALDASTAYETLDVAASALRAAEEAYRIQTVRYEQGAATTTDVLEAETEVARARSNVAISRYAYFLALSALARSVGELPRF